MPLARRLLMLVLAALPVVWGNCPYWFGSGGCGGGAPSAAGERSPARVCPCCRRDGTSRRGGPAPTKGDCDDCPLTLARRGSTPVPPSVELPAADPVLVAILPWPAAKRPAGNAYPIVTARPPGAPPDPLLLSTVVLTI